MCKWYSLDNIEYNASQVVLVWDRMRVCVRERERESK